MNNNKRLKQRITALTLASTLLLGGCGNNSFELVENENNELVAVDDSYISKDHIRLYYVVEMYNNVTKTNEIYIVRRSSSLFLTAFFDVFTNYLIYSSDNDTSLLEFVKLSKLQDYIIALGFEQLEYSYEDMQKIYEAIKQIYVFEDDDSLKKKRVIDYKI